MEPIFGGESEQRLKCVSADRKPGAVFAAELSRECWRIRVITHHPTPHLSRQYLQMIKLSPREEVLLAQGQKEGLLLLASVFAPPQALVRQGYKLRSRPWRGAGVHPADLNTPLHVPKLTPWLEKWRTGAGEGGRESHREMRKGSHARRWEWSEPKETWKTALLIPAHRALLTQVHSLESSPCAN